MPDWGHWYRQEFNRQLNHRQWLLCNLQQRKVGNRWNPRYSQSLVSPRSFARTNHSHWHPRNRWQLKQRHCSYRQHGLKTQDCGFHSHIPDHNKLRKPQTRSITIRYFEAVQRNVWWWLLQEHSSLLYKVQTWLKVNQVKEEWKREDLEIIQFRPDSEVCGTLWCRTGGSIVCLH